MAKKAAQGYTRKRLGRSSLPTPASPTAVDVPMNRSLHAAKAAKQDEFYTQYVDIQKEVELAQPATKKRTLVGCNRPALYTCSLAAYAAGRIAP